MAWPRDRLEFELTGSTSSYTRARVTIYRALQRRGQCTIRELATSLDGEVHQATVYRTIKLFIEKGIVHYTKHRYIELASPHSQHHHHFTCSKCHRRTRFFDENFEKLIKRFATKRNITLQVHQLELTGICSYCSK